MNVTEFAIADRVGAIRAMAEKYDLEGEAYLSFSGGSDSCLASRLIDEALPGNRIPVFLSIQELSTTKFCVSFVTFRIRMIGLYFCLRKALSKRNLRILGTHSNRKSIPCSCPCTNGTTGTPRRGNISQKSVSGAPNVSRFNLILSTPLKSPRRVAGRTKRRSLGSMSAQAVVG